MIRIHDSYCLESLTCMTSALYAKQNNQEEIFFGKKNNNNSNIILVSFLPVFVRTVKTFHTGD